MRAVLLHEVASSWRGDAAGDPVTRTACGVEALVRFTREALSRSDRPEEIVHSPRFPPALPSAALRRIAIFQFAGRQDGIRR